MAIDAFVVGCKADGIWTAIKASCIMAGARTLDGALVPLVGAAPTNYNFVAGNYNRKTGLKSSVFSSKYLSSNYIPSADMLNNMHLAVRSTELSDIAGKHSQPMIGAGSNTRIVADMATGAATYIFSANDNNSSQVNLATYSPGLYGWSRNNSSNYIRKAPNSSNITITGASTAVNQSIVNVFTTSAGATKFGARLSFYSIGESLDLALLDARVTTLMSAFAAAIP